MNKNGLYFELYNELNESVTVFFTAVLSKGLPACQEDLISLIGHYEALNERAQEYDIKVIKP